MNKQKRISTDIIVRFRDIDSMGHVNNAVFLTYFEEGRKIFLQEVFNIIEPADYPFILAHIQCDFLKPVKLGDSLSVQVWIGEIREKSFTFKYELVDRSSESIVFGRGKSVMVLFDYLKNTTIPIPDNLLKKISEYSEQGDRASSTR